MLPVSLDCIFLIAPLVFSIIYLSCVLCTLFYQFLWIVYFWLLLWYSLTFICPVSCVPYVARFSGLSICDYPFGFFWRLFVLCLVYPMFSDSLDCQFLIAPLVFSNVYLSSCVLCTLCCQFLLIVYFWLPLWHSLTFISALSCVHYVVRFSGLSICDYPFGFLWRLFVLCPVCPMLPVSLDCIFLIAPLAFSDVYFCCVLCTLCCHILRIVYFWLPLWYSLTFICPVSCVPYVARFSGLSIWDYPFGFLWRLFVLCLVYPYVVRFSGLSIFDCPFGILWRLFVLCLVYPMLPVSLDCIFCIAPLVFSNVYLSCVLCTLCYQFLWIVYFWLPLWYSLTFICPVSCVPYVASFSGLYIFDCLFGILWRLFLLCLVYPMLSDSPDCIFLIAPLVFSNVYLSCVLCTLCCQFLWIVHLWLPLWYSLTFICLVSCIPYFASFSGLSIFDYPFGIL
jgi:hypothetical protein